MLFTTFKKNGDAVATPVWIAPVGAEQLGFTTSDSTWKVKRLGRDSRARLQPCSRMGAPIEGTPITNATAEVVSAGPLLGQVQAAIKAKYGFQVALLHGVQSVMSRFQRRQDRPAAVGNNVVVIITFDRPGELDDAAASAIPPAS